MSSIDYNLNQQTALQPTILTAINNDNNEAIKLSKEGLTIEYDRNSTLKTFRLDKTGVYWTNGSTPFSTGLERLCAVQEAFSSIELPPNSTTLQIDKTLLIKDTNNTGNSISLTSNTINSITSTTDILFNSSINLGTNNIKNVNNIDCHGYLVSPIITNLLSGTINYTTDNSWQLVASSILNVQSDLFSQINWKIDFYINMWNMQFQTDAKRAMFIEIIDGNSVAYYGYCFNAVTPYTSHKSNSSYSETISKCENFGWSDYFNFQDFLALDITINLWIYGANTLTANFAWNLSMTKTSIV